MDLIFVLTTTVLIIALYFLFQVNQKIKRQHHMEVLNLNAIISELLSIQNQQNGALQLSEELKIKLQNSRVEIDKKLLNLQSEIIEKLLINRLVD